MFQQKTHQKKSKVLSGLIAVMMLLAVVATSLTNAVFAAEAGQAKYLFLFIGDGMSYAQVHSAQVFKGNNVVDEIDLDYINFSEFTNKGIANTHDATSFCPDSASTATSISSGFKTHSGVIGLGIDRSVVGTSIAEYAKEAGRKVGIVSSVTLNHATPAAFYANVESRNEYYEIGKQMAASGFDYFAGGSLGQRTGKDKDQVDLYEVLADAGYTVTETKADFEALTAEDGKVYAVSERLQDSGSMPYSIDMTEDDVTLADYVTKGIELLDNDEGFFMMVESGKIDWACHANDAATVVHEVLGLADAVQVAIDFAAEHPDETLILVTGDHETGGMTIGNATMGYDTAFDMLASQQMSYVDFDIAVKEAKETEGDFGFDTVQPLIEEEFGLVVQEEVKEGDELESPFILSAFELDRLKDAFEQSMIEKDARESTQEMSVLYGGYDPLSVTLTHILNNKAGIGWTSYAHTGVPVAVYANGAGAELFEGTYENTDIFFRMMEASGLVAN
jgi:alkaline phosphatase